MWGGCLWMLAAFAIALYAEWQLLESHSLPMHWLITLVLATGVTMLVGSLHGLILAFGKRLKPETEPASWADGQSIRVGGQIRPKGASVRAPFSGRDVVLVDFKMEQFVRRGVELEEMNPPLIRGIQSVPCGLYTANHFVSLSGFPILESLPEDVFWGEPFYPQAARLLATAKWKVSSAKEVVNAAGALFAGKGLSLPEHAMNGTAIERLLAPKDQPVAGSWEGGPAPALRAAEAEQAIEARLREHYWKFSERVLEAGADVTVEGTYHANPPHIDISYRLSLPHHAVRLGLATQSANQELFRTTVFVVVLSVILGTAHYVIFANDAALYRSLLRAIENAG